MSGEDMVLVPREPTEAMLRVGVGEWLGRGVPAFSAGWQAYVLKTWNAMIAAALAHPEAERARTADHPSWIDGVALTIARGIAAESKITDVQYIARIQIGAIEGIKWSIEDRHRALAQGGGEGSK